MSPSSVWPQDEFIDADGDNVYDAGETTVKDYNGNGTYELDVIVRATDGTQRAL